MTPRGAWARLVGLFRKEPFEREFDAELQSHLELHIDDLMRAGVPAPEARRRALIALGGVEQTREIHRDQRGVPMIETLLRDLRYGARGLRKSPGFTLAAVVILSLGIGANTAIFTVVNAVVLRPLPFKDAERIMRVWHTPPPALFQGFETFPLSPANFLDWRDSSRSFERMATYHLSRRTLTGQGEPAAVITAETSADIFPILGLEPLLGRRFTAEEDSEGGEKVAILAARFWRDQFGSDPGIVGRKLNIDGSLYTVIGVVPQPDTVVDRIQIWTPLAWNQETRAVRSNHNYLAIAKLKPGVDVAKAQLDLSTIAKRLEQEYPADNKDWGALVRPLHEDLVQGVRSSLLLLLGAVALVLLIACANLANLLLVRTHARAREIAVRTALGAGRGRVMTQLLSEGLLLGGIGGSLGLLAAFAGTKALVGAFGTALPRAAEVTPDFRVLLFTLAAATLAGLLAALVPAFQMTRADATEVLKRGGRGNSASGDGRVRNLLVVAEVSLALMLLIGAGLLVKSLAGLRGVDPGFDGRNLLTMTVNLPKGKYPDAQAMDAFYVRAIEGIKGLPGVEAASTVDTLPLRGGSAQPVATDRMSAIPQSELPIVAVRWSSEAYFDVMRIPLTSGRDFGAGDVAGKPRVAIVSELAAARLWPKEDPLGKTIVLSLMSNETREVVGVVKDVKIEDLDERAPAPTVYLPAAQESASGRTLVIRSSAPEAQSRPVVAKIQEIDPEQPVVNIMTMGTVIERSLGQRPFAMLLLAGFAALALGLATVGIYSVIAYSVGQRLREIGIRLALGASSRTVVRMILVEGLRPTLTGLGLGLVLAALLVRFLSSQLFGVSAWDPATFSGAALVVVGVGVIASLIPAWRATRVDPMVTLRIE